MMSKEQDLANKINKFYYSHPYYKEFLLSKWKEQMLYGTMQISDEEVKKLIQKIDIENEVAKYFRAN